MENKSFEQLLEDCIRQIREKRGKIIEDFYIAYAADMTNEYKDLDLTDICLVEHQCDGPYSMNRKYWFEHKPKFPELLNLDEK